MAAESLIQRKQTDRLQLNAVLICEFPENFFQTVSSSLHWKLLLFIETNLRGGNLFWCVQNTSAVRRLGENLSGDFKVFLYFFGKNAALNICRYH